MGTPNDVAKGIDYVINKYFNGKVLKSMVANNKNYISNLWKWSNC